MDAIKRIHEFDRFGSILGLERMKLLLKKLNHPEKELRVIHVAGTNGKGSVCQYLYRALLENGYQTGLFISPFIEKFHERIQFDGAYITDEELQTYTEQVVAKTEEMVAEGFDSPTEFEVVTAIALLYFAKKKADPVILEVGLGGRGDSTNIVEKPLVSIITSISYDHMQQLGNTLAEIAGEKAGIIKPGVPVVSNVAEQEAAAVIAKTAYENGCVLHDAAKLKYNLRRTSAAGSTLDLHIYGTDYADVRISMAGKHQAENAKTALTALEILRKQGIIKVSRDRLYKGIALAKQPGRFETVQENPRIILDGAHNEAGAGALREAAASCFPGQKILLVTGILADKDIEAVTDELRQITKDFIVTEPDNPRKLPADELAQILSRKGARCRIAANAEEAFRIAVNTENMDVIIFAGSLYLIGKIRELCK